MERMAAACIERYGAIDVFCANAGVLSHLPHRGHGRRDLGRRDRHQPQGRLLRRPGVHPADEGARPRPHRRDLVDHRPQMSAGRGLAHYMASKGGVNAFVMGAALELAKHNVTVNAISPGSIMTPGWWNWAGTRWRKSGRSFRPGTSARPRTSPTLRLPRQRSGALHHRPGAGTRRRPDSAGEPRCPRRRLSGLRRAPDRAASRPD